MGLEWKKNAFLQSSGIDNDTDEFINFVSKSQDSNLHLSKLLRDAFVKSEMLKQRLRQ